MKTIENQKYQELKYINIALDTVIEDSTITFQVSIEEDSSYDITEFKNEAKAEAFFNKCIKEN